MARVLLLLLGVALADDCPKGGCKTKDHWLLQKKITASKARSADAPDATADGYCSVNFQTIWSHGSDQLTECQGDCDRDSDCAPGLSYNPACDDDVHEGRELDSSYGSHGVLVTVTAMKTVEDACGAFSGMPLRMPVCAGDCDGDEDCAGHLRCFQRDAHESVPGCSGVGEEGFDYCYDPSINAELPPSYEPPSFEPPGDGGECLCVFDIDRTLTGKQGVHGRWSSCPHNEKVRGVWDSAYSGGTLTLSDAGQNLEHTFCNSCYLGVVSAGTASGRNSDERRYLLRHVLKSRPFNRLRDRVTSASSWTVGQIWVNSPLVLGWPDRKKQNAVKKIVQWYQRKGIDLAARNVHFFGEISCASRDRNIGNGMVGLCGNREHPGRVEVQVPSQGWLTDDFGMKLHIQPNYDDFSCRWRFGVEAPPLAEDEAVMVPCFTNCPSEYKGTKDALSMRQKLRNDAEAAELEASNDRLARALAELTPDGSALSQEALEERVQVVKAAGKCWSVADDRADQRTTSS
ncbi:D27 [Symbiodinium natans]|uniref:D27 protein n=1 Tax=Symbiodinium natans TaxID=878477 RepID=A0A812KY22_9DINO|nr:D27 [Symbiodinium natans]